MEQQGLNAHSQLDSLIGWWELAGVNAAVGETTVDWLAIDAKAEQPDAMAVVSAASLAKPPSAPVRPVIAWPQDIDSLTKMVADGAALPGNAFGNSFIAPVGPADADIVIISDMPDRDEAASKQLGSGASGQLLERMLAAIGISLQDCYWTALATTIPAIGEVPEEAYPETADFVRHQINLVKPLALILLGSAPSQALLGEQLMKSRLALRNFNHEGRNMALMTTFHPRTLISRPALKAQAWKDLQMFAKRAAM